MLKLRITAVTLVLLVMVVTRCPAAAPTLPDNAIGDKTFMVAHLDTAKLDPAAMKASAKALMGPNAAAGEDQITKFQTQYDAAIKAGVQSVTIVVDQAEQGKPPIGVSYVRSSPGADKEAIRKVLMDNARPAEQGKVTYDIVGDLVVSHQADTPIPAQGSPEKAKLFADALKSAGDSGVAVVFVPTADFRADAGKNMGAAPPAMGSLVTALFASKWIALSIVLGEKPQANVCAQASDEASAKALVDAVDGLAKFFTDMSANPNMPPQLVQNFTALSQQLKAVQNGSQVTLKVDGSALAPMMMMSGGRQRPAPRPNAGGPTGVPQ